MSRLHSLLRKKKKPDKCGFCHAVIGKDETHSGVFYKVPEAEGGTIHQECWEKYQEKCAVKCLHCQGPVAHLPGRFNGKYYTIDDPQGQVHSECWEAYNSSKPPAETCEQCDGPLAVVEGKFSGNFVKLGNGVQVHVECRSAYHQEHTEKCLQCKEPVAAEKGKYSGEFYELEGKGRVHSECYEKYEEETADRCLVCKEAVRQKEGFSGDFMMIDGGKVHKECASDYQEMVADKCLHCQKGVRKAGRFSGSFYPVDRKSGDAGEAEENDAKVHLECFEDYQAKLAEENVVDENGAVGGVDTADDTVVGTEAAAATDSAGKTGASGTADTAGVAEAASGTPTDTAA